MGASKSRVYIRENTSTISGTAEPWNNNTKDNIKEYALTSDDGTISDVTCDVAVTAEEIREALSQLRSGSSGCNPQDVKFYSSFKQAPN